MVTKFIVLHGRALPTNTEMELHLARTAMLEAGVRERAVRTYPGTLEAAQASAFRGMQTTARVLRVTR